MSKVLIDRELLERAVYSLELAYETDTPTVRDICAVLAAPSGTPAMPVKAYYYEAPNEHGGLNKSVGLEVRKEFADAPLVLESDAMARIACLEGEIAKRDEELAACRVAVENCELFRAELAAIKAQEPVQVDYVAVMRDNGDGGLEPEWLMEGATAEMVAGMYLCCIDGGTLLFEEGSGKLYAAPVSESKAQGDAWAPSVNDYDHSIHSNPDAREWADFFVATFPGLADKHDLMIGWFANAMMAMHDHLARKAQGVVMPEPMKRGDEGGSGEYGAAMIRGYNACLREVVRLNAAPAAPAAGAHSWRRKEGVNGIKELMAQKCYDAQTDAIKKYYEPFKCANCKAADAGLVEAFCKVEQALDLIGGIRHGKNVTQDELWQSCELLDAALAAHRAKGVQ